MAKKLKFNLKKGLTNAAVVGGTGVVVHVLATAVEGDLDATTGRNKNAEIVDYALIAGSIIVPEFVKNEMVDQAASAALAIGAYRMATAKNVAKMIGINGVGDAAAFNAVSGWIPERKIKTETVTPKGNGKGTQQVYP